MSHRQNKTGLTAYKINYQQSNIFKNYKDWSMPKIITKKILYHKVKIIDASFSFSKIQKEYALFIHKGLFRKD